MTSAVAVLVKEPRVTSSDALIFDKGLLESSRQSIFQLWNAVKQPSIFLPTLFIFLWQATPQSDSAMFFFTLVFYFNFLFFALHICYLGVIFSHLLVYCNLNLIFSLPF